MVSDARKMYDKKTERKKVIWSLYWLRVLIRRVLIQGVTPRHAGSGPRAGGGLRPPAGFGVEPRKLSDFKRFESRRRHLRAYKMISDAS